VFGNEVNAKQRYLEYAKQADREGYPAVGRLFRACARAEEAHADQHVHAIAWTGGEARALLERVWMGTTEENLRASLSTEIYEATMVYPSVIERARVDHQAMAVRSANFALSAEREHAGLMAAALSSLANRPAAATYFVCPICGKTVTAVDFAKCPNCFTSAKRFVAVS
jgi:rubrerythrin